MFVKRYSNFLLVKSKTGVINLTEHHMEQVCQDAEDQFQENI